MDDVDRQVIRLQRQQRADNTVLLESLTQYGDFSQHVEAEVIDSPSPVLGRFHSIDGDRTIKTMINFTLQEFNTLWSLIENAMVSWNLGRGRKPKTNPKDSLFITLVVLTHYNT